MNVALISDLHLGCKKNSDVFLNNHIKYLTDEFIPYLKKHGINYIFILGDIYDNRNSINIKVKNAIYDLFEQQFKDFNVYMIVGNHDTYFKTSIDTHSLKFFKKFENITVVDDVERIELNNKKILMVPWQTDNEQFIQRVANKNFHCDVCLGHFDISGFKLDKTRICEDGFNSDLFFNNYTITFSGHFHTRSKLIRNLYSIVYIGSPYHLSRSDINEERGFCILNLNDLSYKFINSKNTIKFIKVKFPNIVYKKNITGNIVDIHVTIDNSYNEAQFQQYVKTIESYKPLYSPNIVITNNNIDSQTVDVTGFGSTLSMIKEYINGLDINNKDKVYYNMEKLYNNTKITVITD